MKNIFYLFFFFSTFTNAQNHHTRIINFGGMDWYVRNGIGNPANNHWSDSHKSVWIDNENRLHLKIKKINGIWHSAEIRSVHPTKYGKHRFFISSNVDKLNKNIVAAVFLYKDDTHEIDIEFSKWEQNNYPNSQFVVQPELLENMHRFQMNLLGNYSTHIIDWQKKQISFKSIYGHHLNPSKDYFLINQWTYNNKQLVDDKKYRIHINLWMVNNLPPTDNKEIELIISSIDTPISPIEIQGKATEKITLYANHYYDNIFVYCHDNDDIKYALKNKKDEIILQEKINNNYFFINLIDHPIGTYQLIIENRSKKYQYQIIKKF